MLDRTTVSYQGGFKPHANLMTLGGGGSPVQEIFYPGYQAEEPLQSSMVHRSEEEFYPDGLNRPNTTLDTMKRGSTKLYEKLRQTAKHKATLNTSRKIDSGEF
jgi:hypothetical protein